MIVNVGNKRRTTYGANEKITISSNLHLANKKHLEKSA